MLKKPLELRGKKERSVELWDREVSAGTSRKVGILCRTIQGISRRKDVM